MSQRSEAVTFLAFALPGLCHSGYLPRRPEPSQRWIRQLWRGSKADLCHHQVMRENLGVMPHAALRLRSSTLRQRKGEVRRPG